MTRTRRNLLLVTGFLLLAAAGTWAAFRFLIGEAPPAQPEYLPQTGAAPAPAVPRPTGPVRQADGTLRFDFEAETVGAEPKSIVPAVGQWLTGVDGERRVLVVDGRGWARGQAAAGLADKARALYGERYAEFLDNVLAYAYFPLAVAQGIEDFRSGEIELAFKCVAGRIDQAAGIVFDLKPNGDYLVLRANCLEDNLVLFKYEQGKRSSVQWVRNTPTPTGPWHSLKLVAADRRVEGWLNGQRQLEHELPAPFSGRVGVWSKADSVMYFDRYLVREAGRR
ncbi:hypothetical protein [Stenotrophomonas maltophilia]|uniref:hypothetical protein n=1 Tax=Stenotrophomonas maltophilia TaxID=40324 RepID=UPI003F7FE00D